MSQYHNSLNCTGSYGARSDIKLLEKSSPASAASTPDAACTQMIHNNHAMDLISLVADPADARLLSRSQGRDRGYTVKSEAVEI